jgi:hypothetical protein
VALHPFPSDAPAFTAGVASETFCSAFKKLYDGDVILTFSPASIELRKDNIKIKLPVVSGRGYFKIPEHSVLEGEAKDWFVQGLVNSMAAIDETSKGQDKFLGVLFETTATASRVCKFSPVSLFVSSNKPLTSPMRVAMPDILADVAKAFKDRVYEVMISATKAGLKLSQGVQVWSSLPYDTYPLEYISALKLVDKVNVIPEISASYRFALLDLVNSIDLVHATLGDAESIVKMSISGKSGDKMVWSVGGKSHTGVEVSENILSTGNLVLPPFGLNKKRALKCLSIFEENKITAYDFGSSALAISNEDGTKVVLLIKAVL